MPLPALPFSAEEAALLLDIEPRILDRLLRFYGVSTHWDACGQIGEETLRLLYDKLHGLQGCA